MESTFALAEEIRIGVQTYLRSQYPTGDLFWHPLYRGTLDLYSLMLERA